MIEHSTLQFLEELRANNYREWFQAHRKVYEAAKENVLTTAEALQEGINRFDPSLGCHDLRQLMFRINRDVRFAADKSPYKTHFGVIMNPDGSRHSSLSGYYLHVEPGGSFVSCGLYMLEPKLLRAVREALERDWEEFSGIVGNADFRKEIGDLSREDKVLQRVPKGFSADSPAAEYLKLSHFYVWVPVPDALLAGNKFMPRALHLFELMKPLNDYFNRVVRGA